MLCVYLYVFASLLNQTQNATHVSFTSQQYYAWHTIDHDVEHPVPCEPWFRNLSGSEFE